MFERQICIVVAGGVNTVTDELEDDFATMFAKSVQARRVDKGQTLEGTIVAIGPEVAFVDVGGKGEATISIEELKDADGALEVKVGDRIQTVVTSTDGGLTLSRKLARRGATDRQLEDAAHSGLPVEGRVERVVKGGFEVRIGGRRAFCPFSQIDTIRQRTRRCTKDACTSSRSSNTRMRVGASSSRGVCCWRSGSAPAPTK
jgi:small subunit ribosomal protein S1